MSEVKAWNIEFFQDSRGTRPVEDWLGELSEKERAKVARTIELLKTYGTTLPMPHARHLREKLFELRVSAGPRDFRVLYFAVIGRRFILLHGFAKKTQKTPSKEIELAERRMQEWETQNAKKKQT